MKWIARTLAAAALLTTAQAQTSTNPIPQGTITLVVPLAAGGPLDSLARVFGERLSSRMGRNVIIENKAGAGGNIGAAYVAKSKPDGLTWLYTIDSVITVNPHIYNSQGFDAEKDLLPAARTGHNFNILAVNAKRVDAKTFADLLALSKTRSLSFASAGIGSPGHLAYEYLRIATGMKGEHVPYRGAAPALQDLVAGVVDAAFVTAGAIMPHVESGALRALATSTGERASQMPNVPTAEEAGIKGFEARFGNYMMSPAGVDPAIRAFMGEQLREIMKDPDVQKRMIIQGSEPVFGDEKDSIARIAADRAKWGQVMKTAGVKAE
jgi:tripartite-type tricarboxylate transporter receptor subunit TctC